MSEPARPTDDPIDRAHLTGRSAPTPPIHRYEASPALRPLVRRYWLPVWELPTGEVQRQRVLQYPVCLIVVSNDYARFYGVRTGLSTVELEGHGWACGTMLQPATGRLLWQRSVATITDRFVDLADVPGLDGRRLTASIRAALSADPADPHRQRDAIAAVEASLAAHLPVDETGELINAVVARVEDDSDILRVDQLATAFDVTERYLQRLTRDRLGLTPKWLIQRRRLHEATLRLKSGVARLGDLAYELGYSDQAHFSRDYRRVTGMAPGEYLADQ